MTSAETGATVQTPLLQTPSQTVGPYFGYGLPFDGGPQLVPAVHPRAIRLHGVVYDGAGAPIPDALLELWQPDDTGVLPQAAGSRRRELGRFTGFGRAAVEVDGTYEFTTLLPGPTGGAGATGGTGPTGARWAAVAVFARGLMHHLFTRAYFVDADAPAPADSLLDRIDPARRETLLARADGPGSYRFDLHLQGPDETVFLNYSPAPHNP
jgi:protocatechuate 3,4-dioxygenase alpha subunit